MVSKQSSGFQKTQTLKPTAFIFQPHFTSAIHSPALPLHFILPFFVAQLYTTCLDPHSLTSQAVSLLKLYSRKGGTARVRRTISRYRGHSKMTKEDN